MLKKQFMMQQHLAQIALVVTDYDEAIRFYTEKLNFTLLEDTPLSDTKRWVRIAPPGAEGCCLLLAKATNAEQQSRVGNQTGGRVFLFLYTDDFWRDYHAMAGKSVKFVRPPSKEIYGTVAVFEDIYGNLWDLIEPFHLKITTQHTMDDYSTPFSLDASVEYALKSIVSKSIIKKPGGSVTLFAFDKGEGLSEHTTPFEALIQVIDGEAEITIGGVVHLVKTGQSIILPPDVPHAVKAVERFKMVLTMVKN
jgi:quercetin dioxygenase-like cupin family protein/uncharacterized glyoxalase superfamily protein PhnB